MTPKGYSTTIWTLGIVALLNMPSAVKALNIPYDHIAGGGVGASVFTALTYDLHHNDYVGKGVAKAIKSVPGSQHLVVRLEKFDHLHRHSKAYQTSKVVGRYVINGLISIGAGVLTQRMVSKIKDALTPEKQNLPIVIPVVNPVWQQSFEDTIKSICTDPSLSDELLNSISPVQIKEMATRINQNKTERLEIWTARLDVRVKTFFEDVSYFPFIQQTLKSQSNSVIGELQIPINSGPHKFMERYIQRHSVKGYHSAPIYFSIHFLEEVVRNTPQDLKKDIQKILALDFMNRILDAHCPSGLAWDESMNTLQSTIDNSII